MMLVVSSHPSLLVFLTSIVFDGDPAPNGRDIKHHQFSQRAINREEMQNEYEQQRTLRLLSNKMPQVTVFTLL